MYVSTVKDVAKRAGVSAMTVSRVLNNTGSVSDVTREKVMQAAHELHYYGNSVARSLRVNATRTIGVVLSDSSEMVTSKVSRGIQDFCESCGYTTIISNTDRSKRTERQAIETLLSKHIDGIILVAPLLYSAEEIQWLKNLSIPFVMLMRSSEDGTVDTVMNDNYQGGYQMVEHLCRKGCRSFYFLSIEGSLSAQIRMCGCLAALKHYGVSDESRMVIEIPHEIDSGYDNTRLHLEEIRRHDALVCGCDTIAIGAMRALLEKQVRIPQDIRLMGYDGIDIGRYLSVSLSTVEQPFYEIGTEGARVLMHRIENPSAPAAHKMFEGQLIERESTR